MSENCQIWHIKMPNLHRLTNQGETWDLGALGQHKFVEKLECRKTAKFGTKMPNLPCLTDQGKTWDLGALEQHKFVDEPKCLKTCQTRAG